MQEDGQVADLEARLARLEALLGAQHDEITALRDELRSLREAVPTAELLPRPRQPSAGPPKTPFLPPQFPRIPEPSPPPAADPLTSAAIPPASFAFQPATGSKPEAHRSVESRIGSQWLSRVGIVALLTAVALFLKLAIDNHWIHFTPIGRVTAGLLVGAGIVLWSERFRRKGYDAFSFSLKAVGTGTLYLSLWASFQMYHLLPASVALIAMIGVTAWNAIMAWAQNSELLAVYALVGGFATPALLGSGGNHEVFLFSYVLAMDAAVLFLIAKKPWQRLLFGSFPGTMVYLIGWYAEFFTKDQAGVTGLFVVLLSAPFVAVALIGKQREDALEGVLAPLAAGSFLSLGLYSVLQDSGRHAWLPWGAVALAAVYLLLMRVRRAGVAEAVHLALAVVFLTIAVPLKAEGRWITIGWLAEGVALLWVTVKVFGPEVQARVRVLMRWLGSIALALGVAESLLFGLSEKAPLAFWNERFATEMSAVAGLALAAWLARQATKTVEGQQASAWPRIAIISTIAAHVITAIVVAREISAFWLHYADRNSAYREQLEPISVAVFLMLYGACLMAWVTREAPEDTRPQRALLRLLAVLYLVLGFLPMVIMPVVGDGSPATVILNLRFLLEMTGVAALAATTWLAWRAHRTVENNATTWLPIAAGSLIACNLLALLAGVHEITSYFGASATGEAGLAEAFTISAWLMVYAAGLLAVGFWRRMAFLRWQGLVLLVFTIGKVFLYDVRSLSSIYRVLSFFGLGVVLMTVSFAYQKDWLGLRDASPDEAAQ